MVNQHKPAFHPLRLTSLLAIFGLAAVVVAIALHRSRTPTLLGRYSPGYALFVSAMLAALVLSITLWTMAWHFLPGWVSPRIRHVRAPLFIAVVGLGGTTLTWLYRFGGTFNSLLGSHFFLGGLAVLFLGAVLSLYFLVEWVSANAARDVLRVLLLTLGLEAAAILLAPELGAVLFLRSPFVALASLFAIYLGGAALVYWQPLHAWLSSFSQFRTSGGLGAVWLGAAIFVYIALAYAPSLKHGFGNDELLQLTYALARGPWAGFVEPTPFITVFYRPLFTTQVWLFYHLFGVNYSGYVIGQTLLLLLSAIVLGIALSQAAGSRKAGLLLALVFSTHVFVSSQMPYTVDTAILTGLAVALTILLLMHTSRHLTWHLGLILILVAAGVSRENGLALPVALSACAAYGFWSADLSRRDAAQLAADSILAFAIYWSLRSAAIGFSVRGLATESGYFFEFLTGPQIEAMDLARSLAFHAYTVAANVFASFFPVFTDYGTLVGYFITESLLSLGLVSGLYGLGRLAANREPLTDSASVTGQTPAPGLPLLLAFVGISTGMPLVLPRLASVGLTDVQFVLHGSLTICAAAVWIRRQHTQPQSKLLGVFALALLLGGSAVAFAYFRYRTHFVGVMAWLLLLAVSLRQLAGTPDARLLRNIMLGLLALLVVVNGFRVFYSLPAPYLLPQSPEAAARLCNPQVPEELALHIAEGYGTNLNWVIACRRPK